MARCFTLPYHVLIIFFTRVISISRELVNLKHQISKVLKLEEEVLPARDAIAREQWFFSSVKCPRLAGAEA